MSRGLVLLMLLLVPAACGDDDTAATTSATTAPTAESSFPVTVRGVEIPARPERIVSASATHTEMLYAIGAGDEVVATDVFSNYPQEAEVTEKVDSFNLNVEQVAAYDPDLVVLAFDPGGAVDAFDALGIPTLLFDAPATLEDAYAQVTDLGAATGHTGEAAEVLAEMQGDIERITAAATGAEGATYYHELGPELYTVTSSTFVGGLYALFGLENVADAADEDGFGYPQLSPEFLLDADPDYIFLADTVCCDASAETVAERPGWDTLTAVEEGRVVELNDDVASRWGPRIVDFLAAIAAALESGR